jgi:HD-GYP domain-containing protein (c-di-GMP phosphodiesterase class II)
MWLCPIARHGRGRRVAASLMFAGMTASAQPGIRLGELLGALSLASDLGMGQPLEHVLRQTLIALRLARRLGVAAAECEVVYHAGMLAWVGCHVDAYEQAKWFGDDTALKSDLRFVDLGRQGARSVFMVRHLGVGRPAGERARLGLAFVVEGRHDADQMFDNHWRAADALAERLGLTQRVRDCIEQTFERWDGRGVPRGLRGEQIEFGARLVNLADVVEVFHRAGGVAAALAVATDRRGTQFDPSLVDVLLEDPGGILDDLDEEGTWTAVIEDEPAVGPRLTEAGLDAALEAVADFADVKSPYTVGHSRAVGDLAGDAAKAYGLGDEVARTVRRAGLVHDLGRLGVPNTVWDKQTPLSPAEVERVRMHPYLTERMLAYSPGLRRLGAVAVQHHERLDGSGYPRGLTAEALTREGRLLAAADCFRTRLEPRPYRAARTAPQAADELVAEARAGRLDGGAVRAVLDAAGHREGRRIPQPAGLTPREVEVLRLLASGLSTREIAERLVISRRTASHHIEHIYAKTGTANRALATLFAATHGLLGDDSGR